MDTFVLSRSMSKNEQRGSRTRLAAVALCGGLMLVWTLNSAARAADRDAETVPRSKEVDFTEMTDLTVVLTDEHGQPISGALVMAYAMRMVERGGHGYWPYEKIGPPKTVISDASGKANISYPSHVGAGPRVLTPRLVTFSVKHANFVQETVHFDLGPPQAEVTLKAGCEVELSAVDTNGKPLSRFGVMVAGPSASELWEDADHGGRRTRAINDGTWQTMLVQLRDGGPTLFSAVLPLRVRPQQAVRIRNIEMRPGVRVLGDTSQDVPRPVSGYVMATSVPKPAEDSWNPENPSLIWYDWVKIDADGTFEFESLPHGGDLQLIAVCEGWISKTTFPDADAQHFVMGQLFEANSSELSITLDMERTGTVVAQFSTADGQPFSEGRVYSSPNQRYWKSGSTLLGRQIRSEIIVRNQLLPPGEHLEMSDREFVFPFTTAVQQDGTATLKGLPIGRNLRLSLVHDKFKLADSDSHGVRFKLDSAAPLEMKQTVVAVRED